MATAEKLAEEATTRKNFNFANAVLDRAYPEIKVPIYLDEFKAQKLVDVTLDLKLLENRLTRAMGETPVELAEELEKLTDQRDALAAELKAEEYIVTIRGISGDQTQKIEEKAYSEFPREYEESVSPLTGATVKEELPNDKRDEYYTNLLRQAHLQSITAPDGAVDDDFSDIEVVTATWRRLPLIAILKIDEAINKSRVAVDYYLELTDEVF